MDLAVLNLPDPHLVVGASPEKNAPDGKLELMDCFAFIGHGRKKLSK